MKQPPKTSKTLPSPAELKASLQPKDLQEGRNVDILKQRKLKFRLRDWVRYDFLDWLLLRRSQYYLARMEMRTGRHRTILLRSNNPWFTLADGAYLIDTSFLYYDADARMYCLDYHQDHVLPIRRNIPVNELQKTLEDADIVGIEYATNPRVLERFINAKLAIDVMAGGQVHDLIRQIRLLVLIGAAASVIMLVLYIIKSGMLAGLSLPGL